MKQRTIVIIIWLLAIPFAATSQNNISEQIMQHSTEQMSKFYNYLGSLGDKNMAPQQKEYYYKAALSLFVGEGEAYAVNGVQKQGVTVEIVSAKTLMKKSMLLKAYLKKIMEGIYEPIAFNQENMSVEVDITTLQQIDKDLFVCVGDVTPFCVVDGKSYYKDKRAVYFYLKKIGEEYFPLLTDLTIIVNDD